MQIHPVQGSVGLEGGAGNRGVLPTGPRRPRGAFWRTAVVLARSRWWWRNPHRPEPDALAVAADRLRTVTSRDRLPRVQFLRWRAGQRGLACDVEIHTAAG